MTISIIEPHGFCAGVSNALKKAGAALGCETALYCCHALVHNERVTANLERRGLKSASSLNEIPLGAAVLFSAHGVPPAEYKIARARHLTIVDATCPFVARVHVSVRNFVAQGLPVVIIGSANHVEVKGYLGEVPPNWEVFVVKKVEDVAALPLRAGLKVGVVSQTTLDDAVVCAIIAALESRYSVVRDCTADVCTATRDRQEAVRNFVKAGGGGVLVLGSAASSNTKRLVEIAQESGAKAYRAATLNEVTACDFSGIRHLGITSGASTPEDFLNETFKLLSRA